MPATPQEQAQLDALARMAEGEPVTAIVGASSLRAFLDGHIRLRDRIVALEADVAALQRALQALPKQPL